jgi:hypothetical protein
MASCVHTHMLLTECGHNCYIKMASNFLKTVVMFVYFGMLPRD